LTPFLIVFFAAKSTQKFKPSKEKNLMLDGTHREARVFAGEKETKDTFVHMIQVKTFLKAGKEIAVRRFHPWIFSGAIARMEGDPQDGDLTEVYDRGGNLLGVGHFHHGSIAVRLLHFGPADPEIETFWVDK